MIRAWVEGRAEVSFPGGENLTQLWDRYQKGLHQVIQAYPDQTVLIAGHGGIFTSTLPNLCPGIHIRDLFKHENHNASLTEVDVEIQGINSSDIWSAGQTLITSRAQPPNSSPVPPIGVNFQKVVSGYFKVELDNVYIIYTISVL